MVTYLLLKSTTEPYRPQRSYKTTTPKNPGSDYKPAARDDKETRPHGKLWQGQEHADRLVLGCGSSGVVQVLCEEALQGVQVLATRQEEGEHTRFQVERVDRDAGLPHKASKKIV